MERNRQNIWSIVLILGITLLALGSLVFLQVDRLVVSERKFEQQES